MSVLKRSRSYSGRRGSRSSGGPVGFYKDKQNRTRPIMGAGAGRSAGSKRVLERSRALSESRQSSLFEAPPMVEAKQDVEDSEDRYALIKWWEDEITGEDRSRLMGDYTWHGEIEERHVKMEEMRKQWLREHAWAEKQERKAERFRELASKHSAESKESFDTAHRMADIIPMGQPILVGHHSERFDRNFRARIGRKEEQGIEHAKTAEYYARKAGNAENPYAISADDPAATRKLKEKIEALEKRREVVKGKTDEDLWREQGSPANLKGWDFRRIELESLGHTIRAAKKRVDDIKKTQAIPARKETVNGVGLEIDPVDNRVKLRFPGKPPQETISLLKSRGFHWSPNQGVWMRQTSNAAIYYAEEIVKAQKA